MEHYDITNKGKLEMEQQAYFTQEVDNGNSGPAIVIDWTLGNKQKVTLTGAPNCVVSFTAPSGCTTLTLKIVQGAGGGKTATWPGTVKWATPPGAPALSVAAGAIDIAGFYFDGASYFGIESSNFV